MNESKRRVRSIALSTAGAAYFCIVSLMIFVGLGVGAVVYVVLYLLLIPYWQFGKRSVLGGAYNWKTSSSILFGLTVVLMLMSLVVIFRY